ncbi:nucleoside 2-deoxyribosyltransferase domain-containing protein (plasmid) [Streptomyces sp. A144]|nr:nucleoside 2-deoxyribosyltransferase domain-containing protein [Streptomyces sp. A144]
MKQRRRACSTSTSTSCPARRATVCPCPGRRSTPPAPPPCRPERADEHGPPRHGPANPSPPAPRGGVRAERYENQVDWETDACAGATAILFWIPRDMRTMPGMTTNVEFGLDVGTGRAVLGLPPDSPQP